MLKLKRKSSQTVVDLQQQISQLHTEQTDMNSQNIRFESQQYTELNLQNKGPAQNEVC